MNIPLWRSILFFIAVGLFGVALFPSEREMGYLYSRSGELDKARLHLERQFHEDPGDLENATRYLRSLDTPTDVRLFEKVGARLTKLYPDRIDFYAVMAKHYEDLMRFDKASEHWLMMLGVDPRLGEVRDKVLSYYAVHKMNGEAIRFFEREVARGAAPDDYYRLGRLYALEGRVSDAAALYRSMLGKFPAEERAKVLLAQAYESLKEADKAVALYRDVYEAHRGDADSALAFVDTLMRHGREKEALGVLEDVMRSSARGGTVMALRRDIYGRLGKTSDGVSFLEKLRRSEPGNHELLRSLGEIYADKGEHGRAIEALRSYHEKTGGDYHSHHVLGDALAATGDTAGSEREYREALRLIRGDGR